MSENFLETAKHRWPTAKIVGSGRYAVVAQKNTLVYLCLTEAQQRAVALGVSNPTFEDLGGRTAAEIFADIPDRYDADDRRREHREKIVERFSARY